MSNLEWIKDVIYLLPIAGLIWKGATLSAKVKQNESDIRSLKESTKESSGEILKKLDIINDKLSTMQIDIAIVKDFKETEESRRGEK